MISEIKLLDSSVWIEIFGSGPLLKSCQKELKSAGSIIVPSLVLFEVYKKIVCSTSEDYALSAVAVMSQHTIADLTQEIALSAADISIQNRLGMADSVILAHAQRSTAVLVTLDNDFSELQGVRVLRKN